MTQQNTKNRLLGMSNESFSRIIGSGVVKKESLQGIQLLVWREICSSIACCEVESSYCSTNRAQLKAISHDLNVAYSEMNNLNYSSPMQPYSDWPATPKLPNRDGSYNFLFQSEDTGDSTADSFPSCSSFIRSFIFY